MGTISAREPMAGYPFTNPWDISDGTSPEVSTGIPYMYFTDMEMSVIDLKVGKQGRRKVLEFVGGRVVIQGLLKKKGLLLLLIYSRIFQCITSLALCRFETPSRTVLL